MAKIRVKLRPSSIEGKAGTIYYSVSHRSIVRHITTKIRLQPDEWNEEKQRVISDETEHRGRLQNRIDSDVKSLYRIICGLKSRHKAFTVDEIIARFYAPERHVSVTRFMQEQIDLLTDCNRLGTARNYRLALNSLSAYLDGRELCFPELTSQFVEQYNDHLLRKGLVRNSLSFHMRILRAVYNKAVRRGYADQSFPFRDVYTGIDKTRKRAVSENVILRLIQLDVAGNAPLAFARDMFLFSFYMRGMAYVDMAYLRKSDIQDGIIRYARHKTGQQLAVRVEPCIRTIIERYADAADSSPYVFPILKGEDSTACYRQYHTALRLYNLRLRQLSELLGLDYTISSYTSRHSWATTARNQNVPLSVISAGMGHSSERTTQIYLTSLENSLIDSANRGILERLNNSASC